MMSYGHPSDRLPFLQRPAYGWEVSTLWVPKPSLQAAMEARPEVLQPCAWDGAAADAAIEAAGGAHYLFLMRKPAASSSGGSAPPPGGDFRRSS